MKRRGFLAALAAAPVAGVAACALPRAASADSLRFDAQMARMEAHAAYLHSHPLVVVDFSSLNRDVFGMGIPERSRELQREMNRRWREDVAMYTGSLDHAS